eukprot:Nk52_evm1s2413 gene=Nk52_evmTU1s2413
MGYVADFKHQPKAQYRDQRFKGSLEEQEKKLAESSTLYVGNLSFYTTEEQVYELFSRAGEIRRIIMGLDRIKKTPCGFCFVEYFTRQDAEDCLKYVSGLRLDERVIRADIDAGFVEGRQYGRGRSGGQVRDEYRQDYDAGRGGYVEKGNQQQQQQRQGTAHRRAMPAHALHAQQEQRDAEGEAVVAKKRGRDRDDDDDDDNGEEEGSGNAAFDAYQAAQQQQGGSNKRRKATGARNARFRGGEEEQDEEED